MKVSISLPVTALVLASAACVQLPDPAAAFYAPAPEPYRARPVARGFYQPPPYQPPPLGSALPPQAASAPVPIGARPTFEPQVRYVPPPAVASTSLLTPTPSFSSPSLIGPQRADWKSGGGF